MTRATFIEIAKSVGWEMVEHTFPNYRYMPFLREIKPATLQQCVNRDASAFNAQIEIPEYTLFVLGERAILEGRGGAEVWNYRFKSLSKEKARTLLTPTESK